MLRTAHLTALSYGEEPYTYHKVELHVSAYFEGGTALFMTTEGEPLGKVSVRLDEPPASGCIWVKTWGENAGLMEALVAEGLLEPTGRKTTTGYAVDGAVECRLIGALA